jgi:hypothetical protein
MEIDRDTLAKLFDIAVGSMNFTSGFLYDEDVLALRAVAELLGLDPMVGTPDNFKCSKFGASHLESPHKKGWCMVCKQTIPKEST